MTVIYSNMGDDDCRALQLVWQNIPDVNLIEIRKGDENYEEIVNDAISSENDTIMFLGHGTPHGLLFPDFYRGWYLLHDENVNLIRARRVICCWCYASSFVSSHNLHAFSTSMFISNTGEALVHGIRGYTQEQINSTGERFYSELNSLIINDVPMEEWIMRLGVHMNVEDQIDVFNRQGLFFQ